MIDDRQELGSYLFDTSFYFFFQDVCLKVALLVGLAYLQRMVE